MQTHALFSTLDSRWRSFLGDDNLQRIAEQCSSRLVNEPSYPEIRNRFRAFNLCLPEQCQIVIVGQDPYHGLNQATGLAFSVDPGVPKPPSLRNILKEWQDDLGFMKSPSGDLSPWATRGILLMNRVLSVCPGEAGSHRQLGWEAFTNLVIQRLADDTAYRVFCLWGNDARQLITMIPDHQGTIESPHPSPLSAHRGFFGSKPFSRINALLKSHGQSEFDWSLPLDLASDLEGHTGELF